MRTRCKNYRLLALRAVDKDYYSRVNTTPTGDSFFQTLRPCVRQLASVLNAAARLVYRLRRFDHITDALATLHWLRLPERVDFKVAVMAYRVLHGLAPPYLSQLTRIADLPGRRRFRSSSTHSLLVPSFRRSTVGRRSFPVAASVL